MRNDGQADLFPAALKRGCSLWGVVILPSLVLAAINGFTFWLVWGEMTGHAPRVAGLLLFSSVAPACIGGLIAGWKKRAENPIPGWAHVLLGVVCLAHLIAFCMMIGKAMPPQTPEWAVGPSFALAQFACLMPGLFVGVWRLSSFSLALRPWADFGLSALSMFLPPVLLYLVIALGNHLWRVFFKGLGEHWIVPFFVCAMVLGPLMFFLGLLRCLMILRRALTQWGERYRALSIGYTGCVALVLPLAGLLLNKQIPFPADLQNPWPYALTVANAVFLMMPETGRTWLDTGVRCARLLFFPFVCYFFVVFLPFLPLALFAILAVGLGFLILAPTLLFIIQGQVIKRDMERELASGRRRHWIFARAVVCLSVMPLLFAGRAEYDRSVLHRTLDFRYAPVYEREAKLPFAPAQVRRILMNVRRFKDGAEYPYLTNWYNWRVFDNLLLQDEKADDLWRLIVGGEPPKPVQEDFLRNEIASLFGGKTRDTTGRRRWGGRRQPIPQNVVLSDVTTVCAVTNGESETRVTLKLTSHDTAAQAEYAASLTVPLGVWVSGFRLKIGDAWQDGRVIERKAAEWVYRQIRDVSRRDPAILRYETEETLLLRVFPVAPGETREVELSFVCPEGFAEAVMIGNRRVPLENGDVRPVCAWSKGVWVRNADWRWPVAAAGADAASSVWHVVFDCSSGSVWDAAAFKRVSGQLRALGLGGDMRVSVRAANYETTAEETMRVGDLEKTANASGRWLEARGALDAESVLRRVARQCRLTGESAPELVFAGDSVTSALNQVASGTWTAFRSELPDVSRLRILSTDGAVSSYPVPGSEPASSSVVLLTTDTDCWRDAGNRYALIAFDGDTRPPMCQTAGSGARTAVAGMTELPPDSRWARGAEAWRLYRQWVTYPVRDTLRAASLQASRASGVLTPLGSYMVVENSLQWKMLDVKQYQTLAGNASLDLVESPAPSVWIVAAFALLAVYAVGKIRRRKRSLGYGKLQAVLKDAPAHAAH